MALTKLFETLLENDKHDKKIKTFEDAVKACGPWSEDGSVMDTPEHRTAFGIAYKKMRAAKSQSRMNRRKGGK